MPAFNSIHKKLLFLSAIIALGLISAWIFIKYLPIQKELPPAPISTLTVSTSTIQQETRTYRNIEWGFELQYPQDWIAKEKTFGGYYSKFNVVVRPTSGWYSQFPVLVNIVLPEFAERSFRNVEKNTTEVTVDGVPGIKYRYMFEGSQETAIILPLGEYRVILGTDDEQYAEIFNQILNSFKFLK